MTEAQIINAIKEKITADRERYVVAASKKEFTEGERFAHREGVDMGRMLYIYEIAAIIKVGEDTE